MDGNSDYLTLWTHCEGRGYDEKNRMISAASVLIGLAGTLLVASISALVGTNPEHPGIAAELAVLSGLTALLSAALVRVFDTHATRNFNAADMICRENLSDGLKAIVAKIQPADDPPVSMLNFGKWLASRRQGAVTGCIFGFFWAISLCVTVVSVLVLLVTFNEATGCLGFPKQFV